MTHQSTENHAATKATRVEQTQRAPSPGFGLSSRQKAYAMLALLLFLVLGVLGYRWAQNQALATLVGFSGAVERDKASALKKWFEAEEGDEFLNGDGARTPEGATAQFRVGAGAILRLKPSSQIRFKRTHKGKKDSIGLSVELGEADVRTNEGTLSLDSQFGPITIEANSQLTMRRQGERMVLDVDLGVIEIGSEGKSVAAGESVQLEAGGVVVDETTEAEESAPTKLPEEAETPQDEALDVGEGVSKFDLVVDGGASFVVHDPKPPTAVGFRTAGLCKGPARLTAGTLKTEGAGKIGFSLDSGAHSYEMRCLDAPEKVVARGRVHIMRDSGMRNLPAFTPTANVSTDGRKYTVLYQQRLPQVTVTWPSAPQADAYTLTVAGRAINTSSPSYTFRPGALHAGTHTLVFSAATDPPRQSRTTTISVVYDSQAPAARVSDPPMGFASGSVKVAGQALPGWTVSLNGRELPVDSQRRFSTETAAQGPLPIAFSHPTHGMHYYLRRPGSQ